MNSTKTKKIRSGIVTTYTVTGRESMNIDTTSRVSAYMDSSMVDSFYGLLWIRAGLK
nr:hypothetical protein [uncultured Desulfobacter sp.]